MADRNLLRPILRAVLAAVPLAAVTPALADGPKTSELTMEESPRERVVRALDDSWPKRPEWVDMLADILQGSQLGPEDGWFRRAVAQTRFGWEATRKRFDRDDDGRVARGEFPGSDADFARLDRDHDQALTAADFDFSAHALTPSPGAALFLAADRDGNGKLTSEEFEALFRRLDSGGQGFLALSDLQEALGPAPPRRSTAGGPSKVTLVRGLFRQEIGSLQAGPALDEKAPDFTLKTADGKSEVTLSNLIGPKPVVLVFGNVTCGPFRSQAGNLEKLSRRYGDRATFLMVYVREAHPADGWAFESNARLGLSMPQPRTFEERVSVAQKCGARLALSFPLVVDTIDDAVGARYSGMPSRLYLIDRGGKIAYKSGRGPFGFKPAELEQGLILLLQEGGESAPSEGDQPSRPKSARGAEATAPATR